MSTWFDRLTGGKRWGSQATLVEPSDTQANTGFSFLGQAPPSTGLHDQMFQWLDDKDNWLFKTLKAEFDANEIVPAETIFTALKASLDKRVSKLVQNGTGVGQSTNNVVKIGWSSNTTLKATVDTTDLGNIWTDTLSNFQKSTNGYSKLPNGLIVQWRTAAATSSPGIDGNVIALPITYPNVNLFAICSFAGAVPPLSGNLAAEPYSAGTVRISAVSNSPTSFAVSIISFGW